MGFYFITEDKYKHYHVSKSERNKLKQLNAIIIKTKLTIFMFKYETLYNVYLVNVHKKKVKKLKYFRR